MSQAWLENATVDDSFVRLQTLGRSCITEHGTRYDT
jgi:hypothetical protein